MVNVMSNDKNVVTEETVTVVTGGLELLAEKSSNAEIIAKVNELVQKVNSIKVRDRGPKSSRAMTQDDATRVQKGGDLEAKSHKEAAAELGLSYGQIYSARGGYTFQNKS